MANITSLAPYAGVLGWSAVMKKYGYDTRSTNQKFLRLVKCAADKGSKDAAWWLENIELIDRKIMEHNTASKYPFPPLTFDNDEILSSPEDTARLYYFCGRLCANVGDRGVWEWIYKAALLGYEPALFSYAATTRWSESRNAAENEKCMPLLKQAKDMGCLEAMKKMGPRIDQSAFLDDPVTYALIKEAALRGHCAEIGVINFSRENIDSLRYALNYPYDRHPDIHVTNAHDALWLFMELFKSTIWFRTEQAKIDYFCKACLWVEGPEALYQFGSCAFHMIDFCNSKFASSLVAHVDRFKAVNRRAKEAVVTWTLVGHRAGICPDIRRLIGQLIWADRVALTATRSKKPASKRTKI